MTTTHDGQIARLEALLAGLFPFGKLNLMFDKDHTAFDPVQRTVHIEKKLLDRNPDVAFGALVHEVGHGLITRYHMLVRPPGVPIRLWYLSQNACEDPRVHQFLGRRLPGVVPWLRALFNANAAPDKGEVQSELLGFLNACAMSDRYSELPFLTSLPLAAEAFALTQEARASYASTLPPANFIPEADCVERYTQQTLPRLEREYRIQDNVDAIEATTRLAADQAHRIFESAIWPHIMRLWDRDANSVANALEQRPELREELADLPSPTEINDACYADAWPADAISKAASIAARALSLRLPPVEGPSGQTAVARTLVAALIAKSHTRSPRHGSPLGVDVVMSDSFTGKEANGDEDDCIKLVRTLRGKAPQRLTKPTEIGDPHALAQIIRQAKPRRPHWIGGFRTGLRLDMRSVLAAAATDRDRDRVWARKARSQPTRLAVSLLCDLSGSMNGEKIKAAEAATRQFALALDRAHGVSWDVTGFQDKLVPLVAFGEGANDAALSRIGTMPLYASDEIKGANSNWNDDGPCLLQVANSLARRPEPHRLLIVISDGRPNGRHSDESDLRAAVAEVRQIRGMTLIGLGLGAETEHVEEFYAPLAEAGIAPGQLPHVLGRLLSSKIGKD